MTTTTNATWELQMGVIVSAAELLSALPLDRMLAVTEVAQVAPPTLHANTVFSTVNRAPLYDQQALIAAANHFRATYATLLEPTTTEGASS